MFTICDIGDISAGIPDRALNYALNMCTHFFHLVHGTVSVLIPHSFDLPWRRWKIAVTNIKCLQIWKILYLYLSYFHVLNSYVFFPLVLFFYISLVWIFYISNAFNKFVRYMLQALKYQFRFIEPACKCTFSDWHWLNRQRFSRLQYEPILCTIPRLQTMILYRSHVAFGLVCKSLLWHVHHRATVDVK